VNLGYQEQKVEMDVQGPLDLKEVKVIRETWVIRDLLAHLV